MNRTGDIIAFVVASSGCALLGWAAVNFGHGFTTITLPTFTDVGTSDSFKIVNAVRVTGRARFRRSPLRWGYQLPP